MKKGKIDFTKFQPVTSKLDQVKGGSEVCYSGSGTDATTGGRVHEWCIAHDDGSWTTIFDDAC